MKHKKLIIAIITITLLCFAINYAIYWYNDLKDRLASITIEDIDLTTIEDGTYAGSYKFFLNYVEVAVTIKDHSITKIDLIEHQQGRGKKAEAIIEEVINQQTLQVDTIAGVTSSSKTILKAIENALKISK
ncbi:MAG: FMN-binding protein [Bacilli bacterium]|jgi:uncharacterized protein with FMN-binding domain